MKWVEKGEHRVLVLWDGEPVAGSPFKVSVQVAALSAQHCAVSGLGIALEALASQGEPPHLTSARREIQRGTRLWMIP